MSDSTLLRGANLVDAMDDSELLRVKEYVVALLMREQRACDRVDPQLITFSPGKLGRDLAADAFRASNLRTRHSRGFDEAIGALGRLLETQPSDDIHSHGYRANICSRLGREAQVRFERDSRIQRKHQSHLERYNAGVENA